MKSRTAAGGVVYWPRKTHMWVAPGEMRPLCGERGKKLGPTTVNRVGMVSCKRCMNILRRNPYIHFL